jgi:cytidine deaminase
MDLKMTAKVRRAHEVAKGVRQKAYAPYSKFKVGAALVSTTGKIFGGCNVENASYGGAVCAERTAILKAVSEGVTKFSDVVVVTDAEKPAVPCALCLQTMAEFLEPDARVWIANTRKILVGYRFIELLPKPFGPKQLKDAL